MNIYIKNDYALRVNMVPVIKAIRTLTGWGLKEAKDAWDAISDDNSTVVIPIMASVEADQKLVRECQQTMMRNGIHILADQLSYTKSMVREQIKVLVDADALEVATVMLETLANLNKIVDPFKGL
jgi:hypothetical protein